MHIYNITFGIDPGVKNEFLNWLDTEFIPTSIDNEEYFTSPELMKVLTSDNSVESYALHLRAPGPDEISLWYEDHGSRLFDYIQRHWNGRVVFFATTLEKVK